MSMAATRRTLLRWGGCIAYGPPIDFGLPIAVPKDRPLVVAHPAAAMHHHASFGLLSDAGHPFIHVMVDWGEYAPTSWDISAHESGLATWQRIADTTQGHTVCRKAGLSTPHWQVHIPGEAFATLTNLPPLDVLYLDWLAWLEAHAPNPCTDFANAIGAFVHKVREGGLVVLDHKHIAMNDGEHGWFSHVNEAFVHLPGGSLLANKGVVEWMSPDLYGEYHTHMATVYEVHHGIDGALAQKDWEQAMQAWTWTVMPEVSMSPASVKALLESEPSPPVHPDAKTQVQWMDDWFRQQDEHEGARLFGTSASAFLLAARGLRSTTCNGCLTTRRSCSVAFPKRRTNCWVRRSTSTSSTVTSSGLPLLFTHRMPCWPSGRRLRKRWSPDARGGLVKRWSCSRQSRG